MPITNNEAALTSAMTSAMVTAIQNAFNETLQENNVKGLNALATGISNALIPFLVANIQVNTGQTASVPGTGLTVLIPAIPTEEPVAVTGTATGTVDTTGTIS